MSFPAPALGHTLPGLLLLPLLASCFLLGSEQDLLLPLPDLYRQLDGKQEWVVLPLADWRLLRTTAAELERPQPPATAPAGAWIEQGSVSVAVVADRELRCRATLTALSLQERPRRCPLFSALPARIGSPTLDGRPALLLPHDGGTDVLLPGPGRHELTLTWSTRLEGGDEGRRIGTLALPLMALCALTVHPATPGIIEGAPFAANSDGSWTLVGPASPLLPFHWLPGRERQPQATVLGLTQRVEVACSRGERLLTWNAELVVHRGVWPTGLDLRLPAHWRFINPGAGVTLIAERPDGVHLELTNGVAALSCSGWCPADAPLALPTVVQALTQGGRLEIACTQPIDYALPPLWRVADAGAGRRLFFVPGPDAGMQLRVLDAASWPAVTSRARLDLGPAPDRWRLTAQLGIGPCERFSLPLRLPAGWRLLRFAAEDDLRIGSLAPGDENLDPAAVQDLVISTRAGFSRSRQLQLTLEREAPTVATVEPLQIPGCRQCTLGLTVTASSNLATTISAPGIWRLDDTGTQAAPNAPPVPPANASLRTSLIASGPSAPVLITATLRPPTCAAEAVLALQPGRDRTWCRCDLRLTVSEGNLEECVLTLPFAAVPTLLLPPGSASWEVGASEGGWRLKSLQPWHGERLLRLEGALAPATTAAQPFLVPRLALEGGVAVPVRLLLVVHATNDGDVVVERGHGWRDADVDDLPQWSGLIPGEPVVAVLRRLATGPADGSLSIAHPPVARLPSAFIDRLELRTRVASDGHRTLARFLLAAPELQALPLGLPPGSRLVEATIDGETVPPRRRGADLDLPLPGRTQVQVALLYAEDATPARLRLPPPRLGDLPVTRTSWTVGVDAELSLRPLQDAEAFPLSAHGPRWTRRPFSPWQAPHQEPGLPLPLPQPAPGTSPTRSLGQALRQSLAQHPVPERDVTDTATSDTRALLPHQDPVPPRGEPALELPDQLLSGSRLGGGAPLVLEAVPGETLRRADRRGMAAALLATAVLVWRRGRRLLWAFLLSAPALAIALHAWQLPAGPLLALSEWLPPFLLAGLALAWLVRLAHRLRPSAPAAAATATLLLLAGMLGAGAAETSTPPVLMGYERLDDHGQPAGVRVALPRERFTALWNRAHPQPHQEDAICALATGSPLIELTASPGAMQGHLRLAFAVPGPSWQTLVLPLPAGLVRDCTTEPLGTLALAAITWRRSPQGLILDLPPRSQGQVIVALELPLAARDGGWTATLPLPPLPGGSLLIHGDPAWRITVDGREGETAGELTRWDLPAPGAVLALAMLRSSEAAAAAAARLALDQHLAVGLADDHLTWRATVQASGLIERQLALGLPDKLVLTQVEGSGLADWHQDGRRVLLSWRETAPRREVAMSGLIPRPGLDAAGLALAIPGAVRSTGRIDLAHGGGARFLMPTHPALTRDHPAPGADLALRWADDPAALVLGWQAESADLRALPRAAALVGSDRVLCLRWVRLSGHGATDALSWPLPGPWQWEASAAPLPPVQVSVIGDGAERRAVVRAVRGSWRAGDLVPFLCSAGRRELGARITLPEVLPTAVGLVLERGRWLVGGGGDGRLRLAQADALEPQAVAAGEMDLPKVFSFADGERWLFAGLGTASPPVLVEEEVAPQVQVTADHYLVLAQDRLRWWARLEYAVKAGVIAELRCTLPAGARLSALRTGDLGSWRQDGDTVVARLSAPARTSQVLELDLELPLDDGAAQVAAPTLPWPTAQSRVALVDEDGTGLVHLDPQGLMVPERNDARGLPPGIDAAAVPYRWRAERTAWSLGVRRETVGEAGGADGVVTLVDGATVVAPDGETRSRALWHLLNRTRTRLALELPAGLELWEVQVDGRAVHPREDAPATASATPTSSTIRTVHIPVTPLLPGAAATRLALTWRTPPAPSGRIQLTPPRFTGLKVVQATWRCAAPDGWLLSRRGGGLEAAEDLDVAQLHVQRVLDDVSRLTRLGNLTDNGLRRQAEELALLDAELVDHLVALEGLGGTAPRGKRPGLLESAQRERAEVAKARDRNNDVFNSRSGRRQKLQIDNLQLNWMYNGVPAAASVAAATLGPGQAPPGGRVAASGALLGVELLPDQALWCLALRGQGGDLSAELALERAPGRRWPWLVLALGAVLASGALLVRRPARAGTGSAATAPSRSP